MKINKIIVILLIILIFMLIAVLGILNIAKQKMNNSSDEFVQYPDEIKLSIEDSKNILQQVESRSEIYTVKECIEKYYTNLSEENYNAVFNILDNEYISYKGITLENIYDKIKIIRYPIVEISKMYVSKGTNSVNIYVAYGNVIDLSSKEILNFNMIVKVDEENKTFKVVLQDYIETEYGNINIGDEFISKENNIENLNNNVYINKTMTDEQYVSDLYMAYSYNISYNVRRAYDILDEEYRSKRFENFEEFTEYAQENKAKFISAEIKKYQKSQYEEYTQYICVDSKGRYFIINETAPMQYAILLDIYTIDVNDFISKYNNSDIETKVKYNAQKIKMSIEENNYRYIYENLNEDFKNSNFANYSEFLKYFNSKVSYNSTIGEIFSEFKNNVYVIKMELANNNANTGVTTLNVLMRIKENTDFEISLNFE